MAKIQGLGRSGKVRMISLAQDPLVICYFAKERKVSSNRDNIERVNNRIQDRILKAVMVALALEIDL